jgi:crotonobetainyl-CoA:carnitine CoA-transferase CaiB-like acyl-CoA transferase
MTTQALSGITVLELAGGVAGAYCGKLFADMGATVTRVEPAEGDPLAGVRLDPDEPGTEGLYYRYLNAGKVSASLPEASFDLVIIGENASRDEVPAACYATLDVTWFGHTGPYAKWQGSDLIAQAIGGLSHPAGPVEGPPLFLGDHQSTVVGGVAAYCAGIAALIGGVPTEPQRFDISILESVIIMAEMQMCHTITLGIPLERQGVNRFVPTCPLSIHKCKEGWIGITPLTPAQWQSFCDMLELPALRDDPELIMSRTRLPHVDRIEAEFNRVFPSKTAVEWAALGRQYKVPMALVPDARGIVEHPIFNARQSLASMQVGGKTYRSPRTPFTLLDTPPRLDLDAVHEGPAPEPLPTATDPVSPLNGLRVMDFSMGWAGPLATRMLADLGAEVIKIEAGRYPDWWRAVEWTPEAIADFQFEKSRHFTALNRSKKSVSLDLTHADGLALAKELVGTAGIVVENQAAGVMPRLGLGYEQLSEGRQDLIMLSMSAYGSGNDWSDTRAYGSVLEQGSGLPSFTGGPDGPPMMAHLAYGDPIGGIYGGASLLTAIYHQRRTGRGQWINNTQIESMLPFTTPAVLTYQATGREPIRRGNRNATCVPHGMFACMGEDNWVALSVADDRGWQGLCSLMGRKDWAGDADLATVNGRRAREDEIEAGIKAWAHHMPRDMASAALQEAGVMAGPVLKLHEVDTNFHLSANGFFYDIQREHVGQQYNAGLPFTRNGARYPMRGVAPFLGGESEAVLMGLASIDGARYAQLLADGVVSLKPTQLRGTA